jgi:hypothetical protein
MPPRWHWSDGLRIGNGGHEHAQRKHHHEPDLFHFPVSPWNNPPPDPDTWRRRGKPPQRAR